MAELGDHTVAAHQEVGQYAARLGVAKLITVGPMAQATAAAARAAGLSDVCEFGDVASAAGAMKGLVKAGDLILLKASRAAVFVDFRGIRADGAS